MTTGTPVIDPLGRAVRLDGAMNFRDVGGHEARGGAIVRRGLVFRSDNLDSLSDADIELLRNDLRIGTVVDLRSAAELKTLEPSGLVRNGAVHHSVAIVDGTQSFWQSSETKLSGIYLEMLEEGGNRFGGLMNSLAEMSEPLVVHCAVGKDRTGLVVALLLELLGVDDDDIAADYGETAQIVPALRVRLRDRIDKDPELRARISMDTIAPEFFDEIMSARATTMLVVLTLVRAKYGSVESWLVRNGMALDTPQRLRDRLLETA
jgi:protein-tyrosine phosphatase